MHGNSKLGWSLMGLRMLWMAVLGAVLVWYNVPFVEGASSNRQGYQINPKPCWVDGQEGTCMFVFECIKSEGYHIGMCVDAFMFGSCCAHNRTDDAAQASTKPQVLYTAPSQIYHSHSHVTKKPVKITSHSYYSSSSQLRPTRPSYNTATHASPPVGKPHALAASMSVRPSYSSRQPTQPPRHSIRPMSTDSFSLSNSILAPYTKPEKHPSTEGANLNTIQGDRKPGTGWQFTTEPGFVTRVKKPTSYKPKPNKPTKKPLSNGSKYPTKPVKSTTEKPLLEVISTTTPFVRVTETETEGLQISTLSSLLEDQLSNKSDCGVPHLFTKAQTRIVGGKNAPFGRWPWQVSVRRTSFFGFSSTHRCGGAILNENWIATAGHCVDDLLTSQIRIRVGEHDFSNAEEELPYSERSVARKIVHPKYNFFTYEYDLALVQLDKPIQFAAHIRPICLPATGDLLIGENATVTGWGRLSEGGTLPSILQEVQVPIVSNDRCKSMFLKAGRQEVIPEIFLCAGHEGGGQDSCQGDSGGPLQVKGRDGRYFLAGIISWGIGCAEANLPGVCTRISKFVPWILKYVT
ncbi:serine proteinase stubble isoform X1 [Euwallacea similis]|uniref:serine proteinase stubble isoform X1 n=2 Tax=Euwallacea similis TaxID=1736056 RepID=UPI0034507FF9